MAGLLFCLVLKPVVDKIQEQVSTLVLNAWYCDDGHLIGTLDELRLAVDVILQEGVPRGLTLSTSATVQPPLEPKSTIWSPMDSVSSSEDPLQRGVRRVSGPDGITVLGTPVGSRGFVREKVIIMVLIKVPSLCLPSD